MLAGWMNTQHIDLQCSSFPRREAAAAASQTPRVSLSIEKLASGETRGNTSCAFRPNAALVTSTSSSSSSSSLVALKPHQLTEDNQHWERRKRLRDRSFAEDYAVKRTRRSGDFAQFGVGEEGSHSTPFEEEQKVFFVPNAASFPLLTSGTDTFVGSFGADELGGSEGANDKSQSDSSSASADHSSSPEHNRDSSDNAGLNGGLVQFHSDIGVQTEQQGLELLSLLTSCADSISSGNYEVISFLLARLGEMASRNGTSVHRLVSYFTEALAIRVVKLWPQFFAVSPPKSLVSPSEDDEAIAWRVLNYVSPIPRFIHFSLNERLLRAFEGKDRVHIIDFDIKQGLQWPSLFQSLASRPNPPSHVRITGIGESRQDLQETGLRLSRLADSLHLPFEFHPVVDRLEDVRLWMLHVKRDECIAVNCIMMMHKVLYDENGAAFMDLLGLIRSTNPAIVLMAEQEAKHNEPNWETRIANSLKYYAAIFDSLDYSLPPNSIARTKVEDMFGREIRNIVACEGNERIERHESFDKWRQHMEDGGFRSVGIGERETLQSRMILRMYSCDSYSIGTRGEGVDALTLQWLDNPLYTVSAWAPIDIAGSSSTSQPS